MPAELNLPSNNWQQMPEQREEVWLGFCARWVTTAEPFYAGTKAIPKSPPGSTPINLLGWSVKELWSFREVSVSSPSDCVARQTL